MEVRARLEAAHLLAGHVELEVVSELDAPHVLVEDGLDLLDDGAALLGIRLARQIRHQLLLLLLAPPARPVALDARGDGGVWVEREARREDVVQLRLAAPLDE